MTGEWRLHGAQVFDQLQSTHSGHPDVRNQTTGPAGRMMLQERGSVGKNLGAIALLLQHIAQGFADVLGIVHDEHCVVAKSFSLALSSSMLPPWIVLSSSDEGFLGRLSIEYGLDLADQGPRVRWLVEVDMTPGRNLKKR